AGMTASSETTASRDPTAPSPVASITSTASSNPLNEAGPRSRNLMSPSIAPDPATTPLVTSTWPAAAFEQSRAAMLSATPRYPSSTGTASPTSIPMPTGSGNIGSAWLSSEQVDWNSIAALTA